MCVREYAGQWAEESNARRTSVLVSTGEVKQDQLARDLIARQESEKCVKESGDLWSHSVVFKNLTDY